MNKLWIKYVKAVEKRKTQERVVLLFLMLVVVGYLWFMLVQDLLHKKINDISSSVALANSQIQAQVAEQTNIRATYSNDPNSISRTRQRELREANVAIDSSLNQVYGQLIDPKEMSVMLTRILQRETALHLVSLENIPSQILLTSAVQRSSGEAQGSEPVTVQVFKHGLRMEFEGSYQETVRYLRSLEEFQNSFLWENLDFQMVEYPKAHIRLDIYTLSTEQGWIGV